MPLCVLPTSPRTREPRGRSTPLRGFLVDYAHTQTHTDAHTQGIKSAARESNHVRLRRSENVQLLAFLDEPDCILGSCFVSFIV